MKWLLASLAGLLVIAGVATFLAFQSPTFWWGIGSLFIANIIPILFKLKADYTAENAAYRRGQLWDHIRNRPKDSK